MSDQDLQRADAPAASATPPKRHPLLKLARRSGLEIGKALLITVGVGLFAISFNAIRGKARGGIDLFARAPYDIYTDCPEMDETIPKIKADLLKEGRKHVVFVDARPAVAFLTEHIENALSMPMYGSSPNVTLGLKILRKKRGRFIVVYGRDKMQSAVHLASWLKGQGIRGIKLLGGDLAAWKKAGGPVAKKAIPTVRAADLLKQRSTVVFVDARPKEQYEAGHVPGARSLPFNGLIPPDKKPFLKLLRERRPVVVYGVAEVDPELADPEAKQQGPQDVGRLLAAEFVALGARHVRWLPEGQKAWTRAGGQLK